MTDRHSSIQFQIRDLKAELSAAALESGQMVPETIAGDLDRLSAMIESCGQARIAGHDQNKPLADLSRCRAEATKVSKRLDELRTEAAQRYRQQIGSDKDRFEKLPETIQQQQAPAAFGWKNAFHRMTSCLDELDRIKASLLDWEGELERRELKRKGVPFGDESAAAVHFADSEDRPTLSP
ncbi:hypothetical protein [Paenibacillus humicola]|uniref:hypothetical protein n=1 Tax=Paenibacillus humicola TaxID=3110540 RepID=UPI00237BF181|nr:hypothetical protein [Paenibacillus humicola]